MTLVPELEEPDLALSSRGSQRRKELIEGGLRVLIRDGHHGVTFRTVSLEASASHGSVNYYFGSRTALMCAVAEEVCRRIATHLAGLTPRLEEVAHDPDRFAEVIAQHNIKYMVNNRTLGIAIQELTLAAAREPELRSVLVKWGKVDARLTRTAFLKLGSADPETDYAFVLNSLGGLVTAQLAIPRRDFEKRILKPSLLRLVRSIAQDKRKA